MSDILDMIYLLKQRLNYSENQSVEMITLNHCCCPPVGNFDVLLPAFGSVVWVLLVPVF